MLYIYVLTDEQERHHLVVAPNEQAAAQIALERWNLSGSIHIKEATTIDLRGILDYAQMLEKHGIR
jgi:hypothetical protein